MKTYKIEVSLSETQRSLFYRSAGVCRFVYNEYIRINEIIYDQYLLGNSTVKWLSAYSFSKYLNNELIPLNKWCWIKEAPSKAVKQSIMNAEKAFKRFWKGGGFPRLKRRRQPVGVYLPKNGEREFTQIHRHAIKIPVFGWVHFKEYGYLPKDAKIRSCTITEDGSKFYISFLVDEDCIKVTPVLTDEVLGVDLGLKTYVTVSDGRTFDGPRTSKKIKRINKKIKREQRALQRKRDANKKLKGESTFRNGIKNLMRLRNLHVSKKRITDGYIQSITSALVRTKPKAIVKEDLNVRGMVRNRHLSKAIQESSFYTFRLVLSDKCAKMGIELIAADRFYPSSKTCSVCGSVKSKLGLSERVYHCDACGNELDRDLNAAINLRNLIIVP